MNCTFINNSAVNCGGAISEVNAIFCTFINNTVTENTIYYTCGGGAMYRGTAVNCTFKNNFAVAGGATFESQVINSTFIENLAQFKYGYSYNSPDNDGSRIYSGGAMYGGRAINCKFIKNSADYGGSICGGYAQNCTFIENNASYGGAMYGGQMYDDGVMYSTFINNIAIYGGAIYRVSAQYCVFNNNVALTEGNEIYLDNADYYRIECSLNYCNFTNCVSNDKLFISYKNLKKLYINNCNFINCSSTTDGGAIKLKYGSVYFTDCNFEGNHAIRGGAIYYNEFIVSLENCSFKNNFAEYGGAIFFEYGASIEKCSFENNYATIEGNEIFLNGSENINIFKCNFIKCNSEENKWFIAFNNNLKKLSIDECNFINCSSKGNGGAIFLKNSLSYNINNSYFEGNTATEGGAIYSDGVNFLCDNCIFINNNPENNGAINVQRVTHCVIINCHFEEKKGSIYSNRGDLLIDNCNFTTSGIRLYNVQNTNITNSYFDICRIYSDRSKFIIDNCKFINNYAFYSIPSSFGSAVGGEGGAIYSIDSIIDIYNSNFTDNKAFLEGGAIYGNVKAFKDNTTSPLPNSSIKLIVSTVLLIHK